MHLSYLRLTMKLGSASKLINKRYYYLVLSMGQKVENTLQVIVNKFIINGLLQKN